MDKHENDIFLKRVINLDNNYVEFTRKKHCQLYTEMESQGFLILELSKIRLLQSFEFLMDYVGQKEAIVLQMDTDCVSCFYLFAVSKFKIGAPTVTEW